MLHPVLTYARIRPLLSSSDASDLRVASVAGEADAVEVSMQQRQAYGGSVANNTAEKLVFPFARVFGPEAAQAEVYDSAVRPVVERAVDGYNATIFAYGQTGSGKTYTMCGGGSYKTRGVVQRAIAQVFQRVDTVLSAAPAATATATATATTTAAADGDAASQAAATASFPASARVRISFMEIYQECLYDLLDRSHADKPLEAWGRVIPQEAAGGGLHLRNLRVYDVKTETEALQLLLLGNLNRMTAETPMNQASSRSHSIFTLLVDLRQAGDARTRTCRLNFVDLAGSERVYKTGAGAGTAGPGSNWVQSQRSAQLRREGLNINLSLHYLEQCIIALQDRQQASSSSGSNSDGAANGALVAAAAAVVAATGGSGRPRAGSRGANTAAAPAAGRGSRAASGTRASLLPPRSRNSSLAGAAALTSLDSDPVPAAISSGGGGGGGGGGHDDAASVVSVGSRASRGSGGATALSHVPFRNSVLTSVLRDSLGGNCLTVFIATLNPESAYSDESVSTCRFAGRCAQLRVRLNVNEKVDAEAAMAVLTKEKEGLLAALRAAEQRATAAEQQLVGGGSGGGGGGSRSSATSAPLATVGRSSTTGSAATVHHSDASLTAQGQWPVSDGDYHAIQAAVQAFIAQPPPQRGSSSSSSSSGSADISVPPLHSLLPFPSSQHRSWAHAAVAFKLMRDAVHASVAAAGDAAAEAEYERRRAAAAAEGNTALRTLVARLQADVSAWQDRHTEALQGKHAQAMAAAASALKAPAPSAAAVAMATATANASATPMPAAAPATVDRRLRTQPQGGAAAAATTPAASAGSASGASVAAAAAAPPMPPVRPPHMTPLTTPATPAAKGGATRVPTATGATAAATPAASASTAASSSKTAVAAAAAVSSAASSSAGRAAVAVLPESVPFAITPAPSRKAQPRQDAPVATAAAAVAVAPTSPGHVRTTVSLDAIGGVSGVSSRVASGTAGSASAAAAAPAAAARPAIATLSEGLTSSSPLTPHLSTPSVSVGTATTTAAVTTPTTPVAEGHQQAGRAASEVESEAEVVVAVEVEAGTGGDGQHHYGSPTRPQQQHHHSHHKQQARDADGGGRGGDAVPSSPPASVAGSTISYASSSAAFASAALARIQGEHYRTLLIQGCVFYKYAYSPSFLRVGSSKHLRFVYVDSSLLSIRWHKVGSRSGGGRGSDAGVESIPVKSLQNVVRGRKTAAFKRLSKSSASGGSGSSSGKEEEGCFSLVAEDRTLDLELVWPEAGATRALESFNAAVTGIVEEVLTGSPPRRHSRAGAGGPTGGGGSGTGSGSASRSQSPAGHSYAGSGSFGSPGRASITGGGLLNLSFDSHGRSRSRSRSRTHSRAASGVSTAAAATAAAATGIDADANTHAGGAGTGTAAPADAAAEAEAEAEAEEEAGPPPSELAAARDTWVQAFRWLLYVTRNSAAAGGASGVLQGLGLAEVAEGEGEGEGEAEASAAGDADAQS